MKKIILFTGLLLCSIATQAQVIYAAANGSENQITEGQTFTYNTIGESAEVKLFVRNISDAPIRIKLKMNSIENNNTTATDDEPARVQFCFGQLCYFFVDNTSAVPSGGGLLLNPGDTNTDGDHFYNNYLGDTPGQPVKYNMSFIQVDASGNQIGSPLLTFNYIYQPTAGVSDFISLKNIGITVNNTVIKNNLNVTTTQKAKMEVYNITGQIVKTAAIQTGTQAINMTDLSAAPYIVRFTNDKNQASQIKVVKQ